MLKSFKQLLIVLAAGMTAAGVFLVFEIQKLNAHLASTTKITQNLRGRLDEILKERESYQNQLKQSQEEAARLSREAEGAKQNVQSLEELNRNLTSSESSLKVQSQKAGELEQKWEEAQAALEKQREKSAGLEKQLEAVKTDATQNSQYAKLLEAEWLSSLAQTKDLQAGLDKTMSELSQNNQDKGRLERDVATMHYNLAVMMTDQKNFEAAVREYKKVLELKPHDADAHYNLGVIYDEEFKDNVHAIEHYKAYLKAAPNTTEAAKVARWVQDKELNEKMKLKY